VTVKLSGTHGSLGSVPPQADPIPIVSMASNRLAHRRIKDSAKNQAQSHPANFSHGLICIAAGFSSSSLPTGAVNMSEERCKVLHTTLSERKCRRHQTP
jgi:hypothetical protein